MLQIVFACHEGFVTDFGETLVLTQPDGTVEHLPRYGVWRRGSRKWEVQHVVEDRTLAIELASQREGRPS